MIDIFYIIALVCKKSTLCHGKKRMGTGKDIQSNRGIMDISGCCELVKGKPGNTVYKHMVFVAPVERIILFIQLV